MADTLAPILEAKREHVEARRRAMQTPDVSLGSPVRGFARTLQRARDETRFGLIAEVKKASPSKGLIRADFAPAEIAAAYERGGASCLSVLTDEPYFLGHDHYLAEARNACGLPALRKDFMIDPWQVAEARMLGADAILLIVAALDPALMAEMEAQAHTLGMDVLVEVHDEAELDAALRLKTPLIGVNNRNLKTMQVDVETTLRLAARVPSDRIVVGESGLRTHADLLRMKAGGVTTFLVGESLMREADVEAATRALLHG